MNHKWPEVQLGDLLEGGRLSYGIVQPGNDFPGGVPIVRVTDIRGGRIDTSKPLHVDPSISAKHARTVLRGGELLVSIVGTIGETAVVSPELSGWNVNRAVAVIRSTGVSVHWIRRCLQTSGARNFLDAALNTTVQSTLNLSELKRVRIPMPPASVQMGIVEVLGALDDKIAANDRALRLCVELADAKFVHAVKGIQLGNETFGGIAEVNGGGTPKTSIDEYWNGDIPWATPTDVTALAGPYLFSTSRMITQAGLDSCASALYPKGSILMTSRATIGAFAISQSPVAVNQGFIVVNAKDPRYQLWLFHEMRARVAEFVSHANGATFLELSRGRFKQFQVRTPDAEHAHSFSKGVENLHTLASQMISESKKVANARDELLPLLMSGKVRVRDAEKVVERIV